MIENEQKDIDNEVKEEKTNEVTEEKVETPAEEVEVIEQEKVEQAQKAPKKLKISTMISILNILFQPMKFIKNYLIAKQNL